MRKKIRQAIQSKLPAFLAEMVERLGKVSRRGGHLPRGQTLFIRAFPYLLATGVKGGHLLKRGVHMDFAISSSAR